MSIVGFSRDENRCIRKQHCPASGQYSSRYCYRVGRTGLPWSLQWTPYQTRILRTAWRLRGTRACYSDTGRRYLVPGLRRRSLGTSSVFHELPFGLRTAWGKHIVVTIIRFRRFSWLVCIIYSMPPYLLKNKALKRCHSKLSSSTLQTMWPLLTDGTIMD